jgi:hypothetical protein
MRFEPTPQVWALEAEMHRLNRFLDGFEIEGGTHKGYRRIFNQGDDENYAWNKGGRLYGQSDGYQNLKSSARLGDRTGVFPFLTTCVGPRTEAAGFTGTI